MGNVQGRSSRENTSPGGVEVQPNGAAGPTRDGVSLQSAITKGEIIGSDDAPNDTTNLAVWPAGTVQFARLLMNLAQSTPNLLTVFDPTALGVIGGFVERVWVRPVSLVGIIGNPDISLGTLGANYDNVIPLATVTSVAGNVFLLEPVGGVNLVYVPAGATLSLKLRTVANATLYLVEILVEGKIQRT